MSETRNRYGIPVPGDLATLDPMAPPCPRVLPRQAPLGAACAVLGELADELVGDLEEGETWRDEMSAAERDTYDLIQRRCAKVTRGRVHPDTAYWLVEEVLYQIQRLSRQGETLVLPGLGILRRTHGKLEAIGLDEASHG